MTLLSISTLPLFATLAGVCHIITNACGVNYFCLGKVAEPVGSRNLESQEWGLAISDLIGLRKSSSFFEVLHVDDYFLVSLFRIDVVFQNSMVSFYMRL